MSGILARYYQGTDEGRRVRREEETEAKTERLRGAMGQLYAADGNQQAQQTALGQVAQDDPQAALSLREQFRQADAQKLAQAKIALKERVGLYVNARDPQQLARANAMATRMGARPEELYQSVEDAQLAIQQAMGIDAALERELKERKFGLEKQIGQSQMAENYAQADAAKVRGTQLGMGRVLPSPAQNTLVDLSQKADSLTRFTSGFQDQYAGYGSQWLGETANTLARNVGIIGSQDGAVWWQDYDRFKNQVRNDLFGSALTVNEQAAFEKADINPGMQSGIIRKNIALQKQIVETALNRRMRALAAQGYNPEAVQELTGRNFGPSAVQGVPQGAFSPDGEQGAVPQNRDALVREAEEAIRQGADPIKVRERLRQMGIQ